MRARQVLTLAGCVLVTSCGRIRFERLDPARDGGAIADGGDGRARCGDGVEGPGEECDDGNTVEDDGCTNTCLSCAGIGVARYVWPGNSHCYWREDSAAVDYEAAHPICRAAGGHVVTLETAAEHTAVWGALIAPIRRDHWLGLDDIAQEGTWRWVTGELVTYTAWSGEEPMDSSDCADIGVTGNWDSTSCTDLPRPVWCEKGD